MTDFVSHVDDPVALDLLYAYVQRRGCDDLPEDLTLALRVACGAEFAWLSWWLMGEDLVQQEAQQLAVDWAEPVKPRSTHASFMRWLAGEELAGNGPMARRRPECRASFAGRSVIGHLRFVDGSAASLHGMLQHVGYTAAEAGVLVQAFRLMFPHLPERADGDAPPTAEAMREALVEAESTPRDA